MGMKKDILFEYKEVAVTCEESMGNTNEYWKLLEPQPSKKKLANEGKQM